MNILSIDQSLTSSGVCVYTGDFNNTEIFTINPKKKRGAERLVFIREILKEKLIKNKIELLVMEEYAFAAKGQTFAIGEGGGIIRVAAYDLGIPYFAMDIGTHKIYSTGRGDTKKEMMLLEIYKRYGVSSNNDDEADAMSLLMFTLGLIDYLHGGKDSRTGKEFNATQLRALLTLNEKLKSEYADIHALLSK